MQPLLLTLSCLFGIAGSVIYCVSTLRGRSKPHRVTRLVLVFVIGLNFVSTLAAHSNLGSQIYGGLVLVFAIIFLALSIVRGMGGTTVFDWLCFVIAMLGIICWQLTHNPLLGIWLASAADFVGYLPAIVKTWKHPHTESPWLYSLASIGVGLSIIAYPISTASAFQFTIFGTGIIMLGCIYRRQLFGRLPISVR